MVTCMAKFLSMVLMQWKHWKPALSFAFRSQLHRLQDCATYGLTEASLPLPTVPAKAQKTGVQFHRTQKMTLPQPSIQISKSMRALKQPQTKSVIFHHKPHL